MQIFHNLKFLTGPQSVIRLILLPKRLPKACPLAAATVVYYWKDSCHECGHSQLIRPTRRILHGPPEILNDTRTISMSLSDEVMEIMDPSRTSAEIFLSTLSAPPFLTYFGECSKIASRNLPFLEVF